MTVTNKLHPLSLSPKGTFLILSCHNGRCENQAVEAMTINNKQVGRWGTSTWAIFPKATQR
jgi:hypothetical protein